MLEYRSVHYQRFMGCKNCYFSDEMIAKKHRFLTFEQYTYCGYVLCSTVSSMLSGQKTKSLGLNTLDTT